MVRISTPFDHNGAAVIQTSKTWSHLKRKVSSLAVFLIDANIIDKEYLLATIEGIGGFPDMDILLLVGLSLGYNE